MLRPVKSPILHEISSINEPSVTHFVNQILVNVMNMATKRFNCNNMYLKKSYSTNISGPKICYLPSRRFVLLI